MSNDSVSPQGVIEDLADQVRRLSIDGAVLRTAIKQLQHQIAPPMPDGPPVDLTDPTEVWDGGNPMTEPMPED